MYLQTIYYSTCIHNYELNILIIVYMFMGKIYLLLYSCSWAKYINYSIRVHELNVLIIVYMFMS